MKFPEFLVGKHSFVRRLCRERVEQFRESSQSSWSEGDNATDTCDSDAVVRIAGAYKGYRGVAFAPYLLAECLLEGPLTPEDEAAYFSFSLGRPWSLLTLFSASANRFFYEGEKRPVVTDDRRRHRVRPFIQALLDYWDELDAVGSRYAVGNAVRGFWQLPSSLHFALANSGLEPAAVTAAIKASSSDSLRKLALNALAL